MNFVIDPDMFPSLIQAVKWADCEYMVRKVRPCVRKCLYKRAKMTYGMGQASCDDMEIESRGRSDEKARYDNSCPMILYTCYFIASSD